jgi:hypothetical protein
MNSIIDFQLDFCLGTLDHPTIGFVASMGSTKIVMYEASKIPSGQHCQFEVLFLCSSTSTLSSSLFLPSPYFCLGMS